MTNHIKRVLLDGRPTVRVPLVGLGGVFATVDEDSYERLPAEARKGSWYLNKGRTGLAYVKFTDEHGETATVARHVVGARQGQLVSYANGDRLDLRRSNLIVRTRQTPQTMMPEGIMGIPDASSGLTFSTSA